MADNINTSWLEKHKKVSFNLNYFKTTEESAKCKGFDELYLFNVFSGRCSRLRIVHTWRNCSVIDRDFDKLNKF